MNTMDCPLRPENDLHNGDSFIKQKYCLQPDPDMTMTMSHSLKHIKIKNNVQSVIILVNCYSCWLMQSNQSTHLCLSKIRKSTLDGFGNNL